MKKSLLIAALAVFTMASCSKDQVIETPQETIAFNVVANNATKAANVYCSNNMMTSFTVFAQDDNGKGFITGNGDVISYSNSAWSNTTATRYWPESGSLDFYAIVNGTLGFTPGATASAVVGTTQAPFAPATTVGDQVDLLYAVATEQAKSGGAVEMNFRHALSQVEFRAKNLNKYLYVEIEAVKVGRVYQSGIYTLPNASTATQFVDHTQLTNPASALTRGNWAFNDAKEDYEVTVYSTTGNLYNATKAKVPYSETEEIVKLTTSVDADDEAGTRKYDKSLLLLPTVNKDDTDGLTKWDGKYDQSVDGGYNGTYLGVKCSFYNVADGATPTTSNTTLIKEQWAYLPVDIKWEEGKKYIYTFVFTTDGNGGKEPIDPNEPDDPDDVLTPITFTVTVDDFEKGDYKDVTVTNPPTITDSEDLK